MPLFHADVFALRLLESVPLRRVLSRVEQSGSTPDLKAVGSGLAGRSIDAGTYVNRYRHDKARRQLAGLDFARRSARAVLSVSPKAGLPLGAGTPYDHSYHEQCHFHLDHLGSPRLITRRCGTPVEHTYYPFGQEATAFDQDEEQLKFTGHERDLNITSHTNDDLDYMHARYYNMHLGRFLSLDPVEGELSSTQNWNKYVYARNSPAMFTDPTGELSVIGARAAIAGMQQRSEFFYGGSEVTVAESQRRVLSSMGGSFRTDAETVGTASDPVFSPEIRIELLRMWEEAGFGNFEQERSSWLIATVDGYDLERWPWDAARRQETWSGGPPPGTISLVHTHPNSVRAWPSRRDKEASLYMTPRRGSRKDRVRRPNPFSVYTLHKYGIWKWDPAVHSEKDRGHELMKAGWYKKLGGKK